MISYTCITFGISMVPLVVQYTIFNMAPFWTFFLGWCFLKEKVNLFEIFALICSFGGVLLIATAEQSDDEKKTGITGLNGIYARIVGSIVILVASWGYATVCIQTRMMQSLNPFVVNTYYATVAFFSSIILVLASSLITKKPIHTFSYNKS